MRRTHERFRVWLIANALLLYCHCACGLSLPHAAQPPAQNANAAHLKQPPPQTAEPATWPLDPLLLGIFRWQLQRSTGVEPDAAPGFDGMVAELRDFQRAHSVDEQADCAEGIIDSLVNPPWDQPEGQTPSSTVESSPPAVCT